MGVSSAWVRERVRDTFRRAEGEVTSENFLTLDTHWRSIIEFLGQGAVEVGLRPKPCKRLSSRSFVSISNPSGS